MTTMEKSFKIAIEALLANELPVQEFCRNYERLWNLEASKENLPPRSYALFSKLFDEVALFSPFPRDQWGYQGYRDEQEVREAAASTLILLKD
jgi:hypothetical protein